MQTDSASGIRNHAERYNFSASEHSFREFAPSCDAEKLSCLCLQNGAVSFEDFASLVAILPPDNELAFAGHDSKTFTTGAYVYSNMAGLRSNVYKYPAATKLLASVLCTTFPSKYFTSVGLFRQLQAPPHVDTNNQPGCPNLLLPASRFQNGAVWSRDLEIMSSSLMATRILEASLMWLRALGNWTPSACMPLAHGWGRASSLWVSALRTLPPWILLWPRAWKTWGSSFQLVGTARSLV